MILPGNSSPLWYLSTQAASRGAGLCWSLMLARFRPRPQTAGHIRVQSRIGGRIPTSRVAAAPFTAPAVPGHCPLATDHRPLPLGRSGRSGPPLCGGTPPATPPVAIPPCVRGSSLPSTPVVSTPPYVRTAGVSPKPAWTLRLCVRVASFSVRVSTIRVPSFGSSSHRWNELPARRFPSQKWAALDISCQVDFDSGLTAFSNFDATARHEKCHDPPAVCYTKRKFGQSLFARPQGEYR